MSYSQLWEQHVGGQAGIMPQMALIKEEGFEGVDAGICRCWCHEFIDLRLNSPEMSGEQLYNQLKANATLAAQRQRTSFRGGQMPDDTRGGNAAPFDDWAAIKGWNGGKALAEAMEAEPGTLSILSVSSVNVLKTGGHDLAFDTRNGVIFFDANVGIFFSDGPREGGLTSFLKEFWTAQKYSKIGHSYTLKTYAS